MRKLFFFSAFILVLLTAACAGQQGTTPTLAGTTLPGVEETSTPFGELTTTTTAETITSSTAETATTGSETPLVSSTESVSTLATSITGSPVAGTGQTPGIPVTGLDITLVDCQFCIDTLAHAWLVLPDTATFEVLTPTTSTSTTTNTVNTNCSTIEVNNGKQVVLCSGPENTPITLNICTNANTCTNFPVDLLACPLTQAGTAIPNKTQTTPETGSASATPTPAALSTPSTTSTP